jgi:23S rRNA (pseudouridine1915-N3)-methyltransferase
MLHITILTVGRLKERYLNAGMSEYLKRLSAYTRIKIVEVDKEGFTGRLTSSGREKIKEIEGARLLSRIQEGTFLIALDAKGAAYSSEEMAVFLDKIALEGKSKITFVIGGPLGISPSLLERADFRLSFSRMTFPHQLMRLLLLEQLYRWFKIARGETYHF